LRALIDGDLYSYRSSASAENDNLGIAIFRVEEMIDKTLHETGADEFSIFLSGSNNFRNTILFEYKANRTQPKPKYLAEVREYLTDKYKAETTDGYEADDALGVAQCAATDTIICSLDKDLKMIPGLHYSFEISGTSKLGKKWSRPMEISKVEPFDGLKCFYTQLLVGDPTDNVKGCPGVGKVGAEKLLRDCTTEQELFEAVQASYPSDEELLVNGQCLWIWRKMNDIWQPPTK
jgi:5'-3' exonuclease